MLFPSLLGVLLVGSAVVAADYYPLEDYLVPAGRQLVPSRTFEVGRAYFGSIDDYNPFNWGWERSEKSAEDVKFEGLFKVVECLGKGDSAGCGKLLEELRPRIFGKNKAKETEKPASGAATASLPPPPSSTTPLSGVLLQTSTAEPKS